MDLKKKPESKSKEKLIKRDRIQLQTSKSDFDNVFYIQIQRN